MSNPERKHKVLRIVTAGSIAALGVAGAAIGKTIIEELSKPKVSALEVQQPGGIAPSQKAFNELVTVTPASYPPPEPTVIPTKETPEAFDCILLSPEVCALLRPSYRINSDGSKQLLGFVGNLPVGERIFPDITGIFAKTEDSNGKPIGILDNDEGSKRKATIIRGKIEFTGKKTVDGRHINETITTPGPGAVPIAMIVALPDDPDGFNFSVELSETERSTAKTIVDMGRVGRYFPDLDTRTPYLAPGSTSSYRGVIVIDKFQ